MNTTCLNMSIKTVSMLIKTIIFISSSYFSLHFFSRHAYILQVSFALIFFCNVFLQFKCFFYDKQSWFLVHVFLSIFVFCFKRPFLTFDSMCHSRAQTFICFSEIVNLNAHIARVELCILNNVNVTVCDTRMKRNGNKLLEIYNFPADIFQMLLNFLLCPFAWYVILKVFQCVA